jgi:hypothetical protein
MMWGIRGPGDTVKIDVSYLDDMSAWYHYVVTYDGATQKIYENGVERISVNRSGQLIEDNTAPLDFGGGWAGTANITMDEIYVFNRGLTAAEVTKLYVGVPTFSQPAITAITSVGGGTWELTLEGEADTGYEFRSSPILDFDPGARVEDLAEGAVPVGTIGGPNDSVLTTDVNGDGTVQMALSGSPADFVRAQRPLPVTLLDEDFDEGATPPALPGGWDTGFDAGDTLMNTAWSLGAPTDVGPTSSNSVANCVGTNLAANYGLSSNIWLRTPPIDLITATGATLTFQYWVDIDPFDIDADKGTVRVLDASALPTVLVLETLGASIIGVEPTEWVGFSADLTTLSLGKSVVLEFVFESDNDDNEGAAMFSGWYIDDVVVTGTP